MGSRTPAATAPAFAGHCTATWEAWPLEASCHRLTGDDAVKHPVDEVLVVFDHAPHEVPPARRRGVAQVAHEVRRGVVAGEREHQVLDLAGPGRLGLQRVENVGL